VNGTRIIFDTPFPAPVAAVAAAVMLLAGVVILHRELVGLGRWPRRLIAALSILAALMLTGLLLGPKLIRVRPDPHKPRCALLADGSRSMLLTDTYTGEAARWLNERLPMRPGDHADTSADARELDRRDVVRLLLTTFDGGWLAALKKDFDVSGWRFAAGLDGLALDADASPFDVDEQGYSTALGDALERVAGGSGESKPRAVILISDGAWNSGTDPSEVARVLAGAGVQVFVVGVGDPTPPRDAAVLDVQGPKSVLLGDELLMAAKIATTGMGTKRVTVQLLREGEVAEEKQVVTLASGRPVTVNFSFVPRAPGRGNFTIRIPIQEDEKNESNNQASSAVEIVERKINVLLIDGEPRWEFRFIRNVLERDQAVKLSVFVARPDLGPIKGPGYIHSLPAQKKDMAAYDLVILGDAPREALPDAFLRELAGLVRLRGGALIVVAGRRGHYINLADTPVGKILPVRLDDCLPAAEGSSPFRPELTAAGAEHLLTRLAANPEENELTWSQLPAVRWSAEVSETAPGAAALLVHPHQVAGASRLPLLAVHRAGAGKVMFCGVEETWRWRRVVGDKYHYRFWAQAVRWMVKRPLIEGDPRARLSLDRTECYAGETVEVEAYCLGPDGYPLEGAEVRLKVTTEDDGARQLAMEASPGGWGIYRATFTPDRPGKFEIRPVVSAYGDEPLASSASLEVSRPDLEKSFLAQDRNTLVSIAEAGGGRYFRINEVGRLATELTAGLEKQYLRSEYSPFRHWIYYSALVIVLAAAWLIRKRGGLA